MHRTPLVTFISSDSTTTFPAAPYDKLSIAPQWKNNEFLPTVYRELVRGAATPMGIVKRAQGAAHMLVRVSSVAQIIQWLGHYFADTLKTNVSQPTPALRVQIVGHSGSGYMQLGSAWLPDEAEKTGNTLDSNPHALLGLERYRGYIESVMLAGCNIGEPNMFGNPVNGPTLLFALHQIWNCPVYGPTVEINAKHFEAGWCSVAQMASVGISPRDITADARLRRSARWLSVSPRTGRSRSRSSSA